MNEVDIGSVKNLEGSVGPLTETLTCELAFKLSFRCVIENFTNQKRMPS